MSVILEVLCIAARESELMMIAEVLGLELPSVTNWSGKSCIHGNNISESNISENTNELKYTPKKKKHHA